MRKKQTGIKKYTMNENQHCYSLNGVIKSKTEV